MALQLCFQVPGRQAAQYEAKDHSQETNDTPAILNG